MEGLKSVLAVVRLFKCVCASVGMCVYARVKRVLIRMGLHVPIVIPNYISRFKRSAIFPFVCSYLEVSMHAYKVAHTKHQYNSSNCSTYIW